MFAEWFGAVLLKGFAALGLLSMLCVLLVGGAFLGYIRWKADPTKGTKRGA